MPAEVERAFAWQRRRRRRLPYQWSSEHEEAEAAIRGAHLRGDMEAALRAALARYRSEVFAFLCNRLESEADAEEVFAQVSEDLWRGIASFRWECSFRTWLYTLARHAVLRFERSPANQRRRRCRLSEAQEVVADDGGPRPYERAGVQERCAALRAELTRDEQSLLTLRVDRQLSWREVARALYGEPGVDAASLRKRATNLRQRFHQLTLRLRERARRAGLFEDDST